MPSAVIAEFHYDSVRRELVVRFRSGRRYAYHDVPAEVAAAMGAAFAKGEFFNAHIRRQYAFTRLPAGGAMAES
ncbi:MAG: KTSC domain-containing protein [Hyphomonadaceae bacterium]